MKATTTRKLLPFLLGSLGIAVAFSASAADSYDTFWRQLQRTDGVSPDQTRPAPTRDSAPAAQAATTDEWIVAELKKSDGHTPQTEPSRVRVRPVVRGKS